MMRPPPFHCLFCLSTQEAFTRQEHPIPESLGNDDLILPAGFVCDSCNQYFGAKLEQEVLNKAPFGIERVAQAVRNKRGKLPKIVNRNVELQSTGFWDRFVFRSDPPHDHITRLRDGRMLLHPEWANPNAIVRFLLKIGLELAILSPEVDPYAEVFNAARVCARRGRQAEKWDFALGLYPNRGDLLTATRVDEYGPLETRQIYQYGLGFMPSGDLMFSFIYATSVFAVNLSRPPTLEYIMGFNDCNEFSLDTRWNLFAKPSFA